MLQLFKKPNSDKSSFANIQNISNTRVNIRTGRVVSLFFFVSTCCRHLLATALVLVVNLACLVDCFPPYRLQLDGNSAPPDSVLRASRLLEPKYISFEWATALQKMCQCLSRPGSFLWIIRNIVQEKSPSCLLAQLDLRWRKPQSEERPASQINPASPTINVRWWFCYTHAIPPLKQSRQTTAHNHAIGSIPHVSGSAKFNLRRFTGSGGFPGATAAHITGLPESKGKTLFRRNIKPNLVIYWMDYKYWR